MRVTRAKFYRKYLRFFKIVYNVVAPYNVLLDGNFVFAAIKSKVDIQERLKSVLQGEEFTCFALRSTLTELELVQNAASTSAIEYMKKNCTLIDDTENRAEFSDGATITVSDRTVSFLRALHKERLEHPSSKIRKYILTTQDRELRARVGAIPGVPMVYLNKVTLILEPPSSASREFNQQAEVGKMTVGSDESSAIRVLGLSAAPVVAVETSVAVDRYVHKKKASGPNPLSKARAREGSKNSKKRKIDKFRR